MVNAALDMLPGTIEAGRRQALAERQDTQPAAYEAYIRGRGYLQEYEKPENIDNAIAEFQQALKIDPKYAPAYAGLGQAYWIGSSNSIGETTGWIRHREVAGKRWDSLRANLTPTHVWGMYW